MISMYLNKNAKIRKCEHGWHHYQQVKIISHYLRDVLHDQEAFKFLNHHQGKEFT